MEVGKEIKRQRESLGLTLRQLEKLSGIRYVTINEIELGKAKNGPLLSTLRRIVQEGHLDAHAVAHASFDLPAPEELRELDEITQELYELCQQLTREQKELLKAQIKMTMLPKEAELGLAAEPGGEYGGGDSNQAPPVANAGGG